MEIKCPVCGGAIVFHKNSNSNVWVRVEKSNGIWCGGEMMENMPTGFTAWECEENSDHELGKELIDYLDENLWDDCEEVTL